MNKGSSRIAMDYILLSNVIMWIFNESIMSLEMVRLQEVTDLNLLDRFEQITINCIYQAAAF